jgi:hypothetical protein
VRLVPLLLVAALLLSGCYGSDSEEFSRAWEADRQDRVRGMRAATAGTARGRDVAGDELRGLVQGKTHESVYQQAPGGERKRYVERSYFAPDGRFVYLNSLWARDPAGRVGSRWSVDGPRLCVLNLDMSEREQCYTIAVRPDGRVQYFIDDPGSDTNGLLTKVPDAVYDGPLPPP